MSGLEFNKIAGAVLLAGVVSLGTSMVTNKLLYPAEGHGHGAQEAKRGYVIPGAEAFQAGAVGAGAAAPAEEAKPVDIAGFMVAGDATAGAAVVKKCATCHDFSNGGPNKVGPNLWGVLGSAMAHKADYEYSQGFKDAHAAGKKWDYQSLSEFLTAPKKYMKGTKMAFAGISKPEERANLLAYLRTQADSPLPLPAAPAAAK